MNKRTHAWTAKKRTLSLHTKLTESIILRTLTVRTLQLLQRTAHHMTSGKIILMWQVNNFVKMIFGDAPDECKGVGNH